VSTSAEPGHRGSAGSADWRGIWGFPLTPFAGRGIAQELLAAGTEHQLHGGVNVLCACGMIAQAEQLSDAEHVACIDTVVRVAGDRAPVIATIFAGHGVANAASCAVEHGASGLLIIPRSPRPSAILESMSAAAAVAPGVSQVLYHRPPLKLGIEELKRLADVPELAWVKDGHRDARMFRRLRTGVGRLRWASAWEDVALAFWALGCEAFAPASTAYAPEYSAAWTRRLHAGDVPGAAALLEAHAYPVVDLRLSRPHIDVSVIKAAMEECGVPAGSTRPPARALTTRERSVMARLVGDMRAAMSTPAASAPAVGSVAS
jgi:dihydrodipicolinate synthase/N-acetylneuraminate lyase